MNCSNNSSCCVCRCQSRQAVASLIKWSAVLCFVTARWVLAALATSCTARMTKSAYRDGRVRYHLLITGGFSGVFITCVDQGCVSSRVYMWVGETGGYCYTGWTAGGQLVCVCVSGGSRFSSAVGSLQYSWALWGSVWCAALRLSLSNCPIKQLLMCLRVVQTTISAFPPKDLSTFIS